MLIERKIDVYKFGRGTVSLNRRKFDRVKFDRDTFARW